MNMGIESLVNQVIRGLVFLILPIIACGCKREKVDFGQEFRMNLTNDSIGYWDHWRYEYEYGIKDGPMRTYGFKKDGTLEYYRMLYDMYKEFYLDGTENSYYVEFDEIKKNRSFIKLDTIKNPPSYQTNKWCVTEDSILHVMGVYGYKIIRYSRDSIVMKRVLYFGRREEDTIERVRILHRVKESDLMLDEESRMLKDSLDRLYK